jgi:hypothetical protein
MEFWKGEIIVARIVSGTGVFALEDNPMSVVAGPGAGPLSYTIPFSGVQGVGWANLGTTTISLSVGCISGQYEAVPIPDGFKLYSISCDTAVYDRPGGSPVGGNMVTAGQTWFVDPMPVAGPDGQNWTEIFVAGPITGYIPNACVGDPQ